MDAKFLVHQITQLCARLNTHHNKNMDLIEDLIFGAADLGLYLENSSHGKQITNSEAERKEKVLEAITNIENTLNQLIQQLYLTQDEAAFIFTNLAEIKNSL